MTTRVNMNSTHCSQPTNVGLYFWLYVDCIMYTYIIYMYNSHLHCIAAVTIKCDQLTRTVVRLYYRLGRKSCLDNQVYMLDDNGIGAPNIFTVLQNLSPHGRLLVSCFIFSGGTRSLFFIFTHRYRSTAPYLFDGSYRVRMVVDSFRDVLPAQGFHDGIHVY
jgi:hypothetical protein